MSFTRPRLFKIHEARLPSGYCVGGRHGSSSCSCTIRRRYRAACASRAALRFTCAFAGSNCMDNYAMISGCICAAAGSFRSGGKSGFVSGSREGIAAACGRASAAVCACA